MLARAISVSEYTSRSRGTSAKLNDAISQEKRRSPRGVVVMMIFLLRKIEPQKSQRKPMMMLMRAREKNRCNITFIYILVVLLSKKKLYLSCCFRCNGNAEWMFFKTWASNKYSAMPWFFETTLPMTSALF